MSAAAPRGATDDPRCSIMDIPGPRWFRPGEPIWRVHSDAATPIGITTGLLMLASDPACATTLRAYGVVDQPWTADAHLHDLVDITTFGTVDDAMVTIERARRDLGVLSGTSEHGQYFYGSDPALIEWAHSVLVWSLLSAFQRFAADPLTPAESDEYVRQTSGIGHLLGARTSPETVRELEQFLRGARNRARATTAGRRLAVRLRETARACPVVEEQSVTAHRSCTTVVDAASGLVPSDVRRALDLPHRPLDRAAVFGRIAEAHRDLSATGPTTPAPIAAPSAMRVASA